LPLDRNRTFFARFLPFAENPETVRCYLEFLKIMMSLETEPRETTTPLPSGATAKSNYSPDVK
jgi:hypothetical protein